MWFQIWIVLSILWFLLVTYMVYQVMYVKLAYTMKRNPDILEEHKPFERIDRKNWSFIQFVLGGFFLIPIRLTILMISMPITANVLKWSGLVDLKNYNQERSHFKRGLSKTIARVQAWMIHVAFGFYYIKTIKKDISEFDPTYKKPVNTQEFKEQGPITISNHVSWIDVMILIASKYCPSFLSKKAVSQYPLYGTCTTSLQSIYLDRESTENKNQVLDLVHERCNNIKQGKNFPPLHIFPEGTTSSGRHILSFKKGAFEPMVPLTLICLKYEDRNFHNAIDIHQLNTVFLQLCQWQNCCTIYELGTYYPQGNIDMKGNDQDWEQYARKVKNIMLKCLNVENSEAGFRNMKEYERIRDPVALKRKEAREAQKSAAEKKQQ